MEGLGLGTINCLVLPILGGYWFQYRFIGLPRRRFGDGNNDGPTVLPESAAQSCPSNVDHE
jgi:hypothetical protein